MQLITAPAQFALNFSAPAASLWPSLPMCPPGLLPDAVVALDDPLLTVCSLEIREHMRARRTFDEMLTEMRAISEVAEQRQRYGCRGVLGLGGARTYQDVGTLESVMDWMHDHELHRINQIKLSLPTTGEEMLAARERIQQRIAARKAKRQQAA